MDLSASCSFLATYGHKYESIHVPLEESCGPRIFWHTQTIDHIWFFGITAHLEKRAYGFSTYCLVWLWAGMTGFCSTLFWCFILRKYYLTSTGAASVLVARVNALQ